MRVVVVAALFTGLLALTSCPARQPPPPEVFLDVPLTAGQVRCGPIRRGTEVIEGPGAYGQVGRGFRCNNAKIGFVVQDQTRPLGTTSRGGNLIDVDLQRVTADGQLAPGHDAFREHVSAIGGREIEVESIEVLNDGSNGEPGVIRVRGAPADLSMAPAAYVISQPMEGTLINDYVLRPDASYVEIVTTFENAGAPGTFVNAGDFIAFGGVTVPHTVEFGYGGVDLFSEVGYFSSAHSDTVSYAWLCADGDLTVAFGSEGNAALLCGNGFSVGSSRDFIRYLVVGDGSLESVTRTAAELRQTAFGEVTGIVRKPDGAAAAGVHVAALSASLAQDGARVINEARSDADGRFRLTLTTGDYVLLAHRPGLARSNEVSVSVADGNESKIDDGALVVGGSAHIEVTTSFVDVDGAPLAAQPAKLTLVPTGDTERPNAILGEVVQRGVAHYDVTADGRFSVDIAPGEWDLYVSRGFEWERYETALDVSAGENVTVSASIARAFDTPGVLAGEMHQHTLGSVDARVPVPTKVLENAAEGVEVAVSTDHDNVVDFAPHVDALGLTGFMKAFAGNEVSYSSIGHFNVYPWQVDPAEPTKDAGARAWWLKTVPEVFADARALASDGTAWNAIVQVNHPRTSQTGYFAALPYDPSDATLLPREPPDYPTLPPTIYAEWAGDFDVVEVNGSLGDVSLFTEEGAVELKRRAAEDSTNIPTLADYFGLLGAGMKVVAAGNSDTHDKNEGVGYPRNFLFVGAGLDDPALVTEELFVDTLRRQRNAVGNGCFVHLTVDDGTPRMGLDELQPAGADIAISLQAPSYVSVPALEVYVNGRAQPLALSGSDVVVDAATGALTLDLGDAQPRNPRRLAAALVLDGALVEDAVVVVLARNGAGLGPTGAGGVFCYSPPLYIDGDGDGAWTPWLAGTQQLAERR